MTAPATTREHFASQFKDQFAASGKNGAHHGSAWLPELRQRAFDQFRTLGYPAMREEDWHYTSVAPIAESSFDLAKSPRTLPDARALAPYLIDAACGRLVFVNGRFARELSSFTELQADVEISTLAEALAGDEAFVRQHIGSIASIERNSFAALNTAFVAEGVVARIPDDCIIEQPIQVLWLTDTTADGAAVFPRLLLVAGRNSRVAVIETYAGLDANTSFTNAVTEIRLGDGAHVQHYRVQRESTDAFHVGTVQAVQGRDSVFHSFSFAAGARLSRANIYTALVEPGAEARLNGLYLLDGHQHCDHQTFVHHAAERCTSRELYKGILDDDAHGVFNGKVLVDPVAQKTDGKQTNHALLLSERARVDTKPQLEIFADDVKCTHGATVGRLDETTLFYLKSRGISRDAARALLTYAFAAEAISTIEVPALRDSLQQLAFDRYNQPRKA